MKTAITIKDQRSNEVIEIVFGEIKRATVKSITQIEIEYHCGAIRVYDFGIDGMRRMRNWLLVNGALLNRETWPAKSPGVSEDQIRRDLKLPPLCLEHMTRAAASAIGWDVAAYEWCDEVNGLRLGEITQSPHDADPLIFAPLADPGDAFVVEAMLHLNVNYKSCGQTIVITVSCLKHAELSYMTSMPSTADKAAAIAKRMLAVTQFAAMVDLVEDGSNG